MMILSYLLFSYYYFKGWWYSGIGTLLIAFFAYMLWRRDFLFKIGLKMNAIVIIFSVSLALLMSTAGYGLMKSVASKNEVMIQYSDYRNYIHDFFYTLNEEIILGAVLLGLTRQIIKKMPPAAISIIVAILFAIFHYLFYRWVFIESGILSSLTLLTLVLVGILRNNLILTTGHVGFSWAVHVSWMAVMFGTYHYYIDSLESLPEFERFNLYLGSPLLSIIITALAVLSFSLYWPKFRHPKLISKP